MTKVDKLTFAQYFKIFFVIFALIGFIPFLPFQLISSKLSNSYCANTTHALLLGDFGSPANESNNIFTPFSQLIAGKTCNIFFLYAINIPWFIITALVFAFMTKNIPLDSKKKK